MELVRMWAGHLIRRGWRATIFLALLAGLAGGLAMAAWAAGRRTATSFDRFVEWADPGELIITFCPPGFELVDRASLEECFAYAATEEIAALNALPEVEVAAQAAFRGASVRRVAAPDERYLAGSTYVLDERITGFEGRQILVDGRQIAPGAADEVVVNEAFVEQSDVTVGEDLVLTFWAPGEFGSIPQPGEDYNGPTARARVVGVVRGILDLDVATTDVSRIIEQAEVLGGPAFARATGAATGFGGVLIRAADGDADAAAAAIRGAFPGQLFNLSPAVGTDELEPTEEAIQYEARAATAFAAITAAAAAVFVGQAAARQSRREWSDAATLRALGMSNRDVRWTAGLRALVIAALAAVVAVVSAALLSPLGPIGVGRRAEVDPGPSLDPTVLVIGAFGVFMVVTAATWLPPLRAGVSRPDGPASRRGGIRGPLPPSAVAGLGMTVGGGQAGRRIPVGAALGGLALAIGAMVAALGTTASLTAVTNSPERFGAPWDVSVGTSQLTDANATAFLELFDDPAITAAAGIVGTEISVGDEVVWVQAFQPFDGSDAIRPVITSGREPAAINEIAFGSITMDDLDVQLGDTVEVVGTDSIDTGASMTVVGTTLVNDTYESSPGRGGIVTPEWIETHAQESAPDPVVLRLDDETDVNAFSADLQQRFNSFVSPPLRQAAILNVERISSLPFVLVAVVGVLAIASLTHALVLSVRRSRSQLAVWRAIGFTRGQVRSAVAWHASVLALGAALIGVPIGIIIGRVGWRLVAEQIGVASGPATPYLSILVAVVGALLAANVVATFPAWRAARVPTAEALRVE